MMSDNNNLPNTLRYYADLFDVPERHTLRLSRSKKIEQASVVYETQWFDEHDSDSKLVARFRSWTNNALSPPYRRQTGWERFSLSGNLLDREVRYSKRKDNDYVH